MTQQSSIHGQYLSNGIKMIIIELRSKKVKVNLLLDIEEEELMRNVSEIIEQYLKQVLQQSSEGAIEIQRNELADQFQCVPSQINYVISTRFTLEKGYIVESKRGGGGYIRIQKIELRSHGSILDLIFQTIHTHIDQVTSEGLIYQLQEAHYISAREANLMKAAISRDVLIFKLPLRDEIRAKILKAMLISLLSK
jgi:transcriptional regulator of stress and heat shock response